MKRDMDLIRKILQLVESCDNPYGVEELPEINGYDPATVSYQIRILKEANLISAEPIDERGHGYTDYYGIHLTWDGHEFLAATYDNSIWAKAKETIIKPGASFTFQLLRQYLEMKAKEKLGIP